MNKLGNKLNSLDEEGSFLLSTQSFIKNFYKRLALFSISGLILAAFYLLVTPNKYEATAQIQLARIPLVSPAPGAQYIPSSLINVGDPAILLLQFSSMRLIKSESVEICNFDNKTSGVGLATLRLSLIKNTSDALELKVMGSTPSNAKLCATQIYELIKSSQQVEIDRYLSNARKRLLFDRDRLNFINNSIREVDISRVEEAVKFISLNDERRYLSDEISSIEIFLSGEGSYPVKLISPIDSSDVPVSPKKNLILFEGLFFGLCLGIFSILLGQKPLQ